MQNLFIIHSYNADTKESFGPYIAEYAKNIGLNVIFPDFPIKEKASYKSWSEIMDQYLLSGELNENSIVVAHSLGTHFIPKYLAKKNIPINLYISCAGFLHDHSGKESLKPIIEDFLPSEEQIDKFIQLVPNRYSIYSDNDHMNPQEELEHYAERFNAEKVFIPNIGHLGKRSGITELPEAIEIIKNVLKLNCNSQRRAI